MTVQSVEFESSRRYKWIGPIWIHVRSRHE